MSAAAYPNNGLERIARTALTRCGVSEIYLPQRADEPSHTRRSIVMKTANRLLTAITTLTMLSAAPVWTQAARPSAPADASATAVRKGMTWQQLTPINFNGTISVSCDNVCDAYHGDTTCTTELPLLCIRKAGAGFPLPLPQSVINSDKYLMWSGGIVGTTHAMVPPRTLTAANAACAKVFGANWRVAEFHDGWGWGFQAFGGLGSNPGTHLWVDINDQPGATCWTRP
jgi:hypothetical protein